MCECEAIYINRVEREQEEEKEKAKRKSVKSGENREEKREKIANNLYFIIYFKYR